MWQHKDRGYVMNESRVLYKIRTLEATILRKMEPKIGDNIKVRNHPTITQIRIIEYILKNNNKDIYQKDLENILNLRRATVSGVLQTMEKNGLIERTTSNDDSRTKKIILNSSAKEMFLKGEERIKMMEEKSLKGISKEELSIFLNVLDKMRNNINEL